MQNSTLRRSPWTLVAVAAGIVGLISAAALGSGTTRGQTPASGSPAPTAGVAATAPAAAAAAARPSGALTASPAPAIENEAAVRMILPPSIRGSDKLPVRKWARADLPDAPGGYVVFIATIYPLYDGQGGSTEWLLVNYLQWDGTQWLIASPDDPGTRLSGDDIWLARNLTDISAIAPPAGQAWQVVTVGYTADGLVSPTLARTETVVEIYDLALTTVWSRVDYLRETDTSNAGYVEQRGEDVDWTFRDLDADGVDELIATVVDTDTIVLAGAPAAGLPAAGTTQNTTTEIWKWNNGVYGLQSSGAVPGAASPARPAASPAATRAAPAPTPAPTAPARAATSAAPFAAPAGATPAPTPSGPVG